MQLGFGLRVDEGLRFLGCVLENLAHVGGQAVPAPHPDGNKRRRVDVTGERQVGLHLLELLRVNLGERVLLAVHHAGRERGEDLGELHRAWIRAVRLEHLEPPLALGHAQLDAL